MASAAATLKVAPAEGPLSTTTPHLMPFHIGYSGPAPISTYFRVQAAPEPTFGREKKCTTPETTGAESQETSDSQNTVVASPSDPSSTAVPSSSNSAATLVDADMQESSNASSSSTGSPRHYTAAFRGRLMHGMKVDLPEGYAGVVLRTPDDHKPTAPSSGSTGGRTRSKGAVRSAKRSKRDEDDAIDVDEEMPDAPEEEGPVRVLTPAAQFSSFVLWHPDIPVDEGRDEYLRSLTEWTRLAAEIHRVEDC
ncbi:hypothetical protein OH77DRAFT_1421538 [Trametes cingulata]|nr:hypothetical protein OH77DRAFT_1421538 [Trametes cingulata]